MGNDVIFCFPTGYAKSLFYFILSLVFNALRNDAQGLTSTARDHGTPLSRAVVVSPLQALMQDQVLSLRDKGVSAVIASNFSENVETLKSDIVCGKYQFFSNTRIAIDI
uniref:DEAD/DEAH-box helicase domain-containing protein n=1 Tax=Amphimedon queenslandica TaxID=400682 RepID=A0A1X7V384_AMPQE